MSVVRREKLLSVAVRFVTFGPVLAYLRLSLDLACRSPVWPRNT